MTGFHRNRRSKRLKTVHLPMSYSIGRMHAPLSIFKFANLTLTNPDSQDPKYCGWWFERDTRRHQVEALPSLV
jgi:hypothetical protein